MVTLFEAQQHLDETQPCYQNCLYTFFLYPNRPYESRVSFGSSAMFLFKHPQFLLLQLWVINCPPLMIMIKLDNATQKSILWNLLRSTKNREEDVAPFLLLQYLSSGVHNSI
ncbi:hypothetical protein HAX54_021470 [Datura stramonium]|uniref:Uncharacterized protein n=1 Tax=Datura stramonium TaxID=4076 RepID=A0ABS8UVR8_DATST|nr:hypothetical protein [Datura stramonium]